MAQRGVRTIALPRRQGAADARSKGAHGARYHTGVPPGSDVLVIGGGIIGLATAWRLLQARPDLRVALLEKEDRVAAHQTGRNSGVVHSGIYYRPGSSKAAFCREGRQALERFCREEGVAFETCGKVVVAATEDEIPRLRELESRAVRNGVKCEWIGPERLRELEPRAAGLAALHVPETGIVDYEGVCRRLAARIEDAQGHLTFGARVTGFRAGTHNVVVRTTRGDFEAACVVNCAGLHSDRVARLAGSPRPARIVPFRGEYYELVPQRRSLCRNLIYPVPDPAFPFLGVHFTRLVAGGVECGPNAVLAFAREGYRRTDVNARDLVETLTYAGFLRLAARHWRMGIAELQRSWSKRAFVRALQGLVPEIGESDLTEAPSGVRAQAVAPDGSLVDDFLLTEDARFVHVNNAPSPAATAALRIGEGIAGRVLARIGGTILRSARLEGTRTP